MMWPARWFDRTFHYVQEKFPLKPHGYALWAMGGDRQVTFQPHVSRKGNYHHPRHLMLNLLALERMIERGGGVSDFWWSTRELQKTRGTVGKPAQDSDC